MNDRPSVHGHTRGSSSPSEFFITASRNTFVTIGRCPCVRSDAICCKNQSSPNLAVVHF
jgi:hypothetical protein